VGLDDLMSTESAFVAAATAAIFSPRTRETMRRGAVIGVAGALRAGDVVVGAARGVARGVSGGQSGASANGQSRSRSATSSRRSSRSSRSTTSRSRSTGRKTTSK
jgi:hypothetical protein